MLLTPRHYRTPRTSGEVLADPPLSDAAQRFLANRDSLRRASCASAGLLGCRDRAAAREELIAAAVAYTGQYADLPSFAPNPVGDAPPVILAGHQPTFFHPGVWLKNFALAALAREQGAWGINLLVDSDTLRGTTLRVPGGSPAVPHVAPVPFDAPGPEAPYEDREILDRATFASFGARAAESLAPFVSAPIVRDYWPRVVAASRRESRLGRCLAQGRHELEREIGGGTLELPLGQLCEGRAFRRFAAALLLDLPRFRAAYNGSIADYRRAYKVRSRSHPAPELAADGEWIEAPLRIWSRESPRRRPVFIAARGDSLRLTDRHGLERTLFLGGGDPIESLAEQLGEFPAAGMRLRPRALLTTLFSRLLLCDLFLHGIGGGMYDQVTDQIIAGYYGIEPPSYLVLSGTWQLPLVESDVSLSRLRQIERELRQTEFDPGKQIAPDDHAAQQLAAERALWVAQRGPRGTNAERHRAIRELDGRLAPHVAARRAELAAERERVATELKRQQLLGSREFAFCLFPASLLDELPRAAASRH